MVKPKAKSESFIIQLSSSDQKYTFLFASSIIHTQPCEDHLSFYATVLHVVNTITLSLHNVFILYRTVALKSATYVTNNNCFVKLYLQCMRVLKNFLLQKWSPA